MVDFVLKNKIDERNILKNDNKNLGVKMSRHCLAEIETHDPSGRKVTLYIYVQPESRTAIYEPILTDGQIVGLSHIFRVGTKLPDKIQKSDESQKIDEIEEKMRFLYSKVKKNFR